MITNIWEINKRRRILVRPRQQLKLALVFAGVCGLYLFFTIGVFALQMKLSANQMAELDPMGAQRLWAASGSVLQLLAGYSFVLLCFSFAIGVVLSHRLFGPVVPIVRHIEALRSGDTRARIHLRRSDELSEVALALNRLADTFCSAPQRRISGE